MKKFALYVLTGLGVIVVALVALGIYGEFFRPQSDYCEFAEQYAIAVEGASASREITEASVEFVSKVGGAAADPIPDEISGSAESLIDIAKSAAAEATPDLLGEKRTEILRSARRMLQDCGMDPVVRGNQVETGRKYQSG